MRKTGMVIIRLVLFLFGAAGFAGLVMPLIKRRILNIGNAAGLSVCTILMLYALFMPYHRYGNYGGDSAGTCDNGMHGEGIICKACPKCDSCDTRMQSVW